MKTKHVDKQTAAAIYAAILFAIALFAAACYLFMPQLNELFNDGSGYKPR